MPTITRAPNAINLPHALAKIERRLYALQHEVLLVADVATSGQHASLHQLSLETLTVALRGHADRIEKLHDDVECLAVYTKAMADMDARTNRDQFDDPRKGGLS